MSSINKFDLRLVTLLNSKRSAKKIHVVGTSNFSIVASACSSSIPWEGDGFSRLVVLPKPEDFVLFKECLDFFKCKKQIHFLQGWDVSPYSGLYPNPKISSSRISWLYHAQNATPNDLFVTDALTFQQKCVPFSLIANLSFKLKAGESIPSDFFNKLSHLGYHSSTVVDQYGTFSQRGSILDIYSPAHLNPVRIELFGDLIESMRSFDVETQRSDELPITELEILPAREILYSDDSIESVISKFKEQLVDRTPDPDDLSSVFHALTQKQNMPGLEFLLYCFYEKLTHCTDHFSNPVNIISIDPLDSLHIVDTHFETLKTEYLSSTHLAIRPSIENIFYSNNYQSFPDDYKSVGFSKVHFIENDKKNDDEIIIEYPCSDLSEFLKQTSSRVGDKNSQILFLKEKLNQFLNEELNVFVCVHSKSSSEKLKVLFEMCEVDCTTKEFIDINENDPQDHPPQLVILIGPSPKPFRSNQDKLLILNEQFIWGRKRAVKTSSSQKEYLQATGALNFSDLKPGQLIVHKIHGVGSYVGLTVMDIGGVPSEMIHVKYQGNDSLYIPVYRIGQLHKYSGPENSHFIDKLGSNQWSKTTTKAKKHLRDIALDLLSLYAKRKQTTRTEFNIDSNDYIGFENSFSYEDTPDQQRATIDIISDFKSLKPMDRLLCGDVGFGKTEIAMRAAFMAVQNGMQVAVIAPTTVLTFQHTQTFKKRFAQWPIKICTLNRFVSKADVKNNLTDLEAGRADIVIGTHRLLSKDIKFKNLGLLIIDEEQKFGVKHKEKIRALKSQVDTLALSATPIPRTLNMSLMGLRDLSLLNTAPVDRLPTRTFVCRYDKETIRKAILSEVSRGGQVFFIHNRVQSIYGIAEEIRQIVPEVRMSVAHGQMDENQLESTMIKFFNHEIDLLICTTIVESGVDVPRANTMIIDRADTFGLSQLYQLRGRVGRSKERAYCYLIIPPNKKLDSDAQERLKVIQENTALGSGIKVAHYDLELRGAGELLGEEQSGHIQSLGYELYMELLDEAIREAKGEPIGADNIEPELNLRIPALIPDKYIPDIRMRLYYYKLLSDIRSEEEVEKIEEELRDQFGKPPEEVLNLLGLMMIRSLCKDLSIKDIASGAQRVSLSFTEYTPLSVPKVIELTLRENKKYQLTPDNRLIIRMKEITWPNVYEELNFLKRKI